MLTNKTFHDTYEKHNMFTQHLDQGTDKSSSFHKQLRLLSSQSLSPNAVGSWARTCQFFSSCPEEVPLVQSQVRRREGAEETREQTKQRPKHSLHEVEESPATPQHPQRRTPEAGTSLRLLTGWRGAIGPSPPCLLTSSLTAASTRFLNAAGDGDCSTSLGSLCRCLTALYEKKFLLISNLNFPWCNMMPLLLVSSPLSDHVWQ
ncbi:uncharacterized protein LOC122178921 [Lagopus leucura]|uniref:uncharacterized protein LOC122178921 n=1 Tax=Lagopus leucura TaxID=30410 RepID=UPI001C6752DD|nr:uncharacterized protein LOC122178921 [Lagopus leucura]